MRLGVVCAGARHGAGRCRAADATPRCAGCAAVLALGSRRRTLFTRCARCARTAAASQLWKRAGTRADPRAAFLAVAYAARRRPAPCLAGDDRSWERVFGKPRGIEPRSLPRAAGALPGEGRARCPALALPSNKEQAVPRQAVGGCALARLCGGEEHRVSVGARTRALAHLTRRNCLNATSAASEVSFAARPKPEHRSAVGAPLAPTAAVARQRAPAHGLAPASTSTKRTFKDRNGPSVDVEMRRRFIVRTPRDRRARR